MAALPDIDALAPDQAETASAEFPAETDSQSEVWLDEAGGAQVAESVQEFVTDPRNLDLSDGMDGFFGSLNAETPTQELTFSPAEDGRIDIVMSSSFGDSAAMLSVINSQGDVIETKSEGLAGFNQLSFDADGGEEYRIVVAADDAGTDGQFQVTVGFERHVDQHADQPGVDSTELDLQDGSTELTGRLETAGDTDTFRFTAAESGEGLIGLDELVDDERIDLSISVLDSNGNVIAEGSTNRSVEIEFDVEAGAEYFVSVTAGENQDGVYGLQLQTPQPTIAAGEVATDDVDISADVEADVGADVEAVSDAAGDATSAAETGTVDEVASEESGPTDTIAEEAAADEAVVDDVIIADDAQIADPVDLSGSPEEIPADATDDEAGIVGVDLEEISGDLLEVAEGIVNEESAETGAIIDEIVEVVADDILNDPILIAGDDQSAGDEVDLEVPAETSDPESSQSGDVEIVAGDVADDAVSLDDSAVPGEQAGDETADETIVAETGWDAVAEEAITEDGTIEEVVDAEVDATDVGADSESVDDGELTTEEQVAESDDTEVSPAEETETAELIVLENENGVFVATGEIDAGGNVVYQIEATADGAISLDAEALGDNLDAQVTVSVFRGDELITSGLTNDDVTIQFETASGEEFRIEVASNEGQPVSFELAASYVENSGSAVDGSIADDILVEQDPVPSAGVADGLVASENDDSEAGGYEEQLGAIGDSLDDFFESLANDLEELDLFEADRFTSWVPFRGFFNRI